MDVGVQLIEPLTWSGVAMAMIGVVAWNGKRLAEVIHENSKAIAKLSVAIEKIDDRLKTETELLRSLHDKLLARPCLRKKED